MGVDETREDSIEAKKYIYDHNVVPDPMWDHIRLMTFLNKASKHLISIIYAIFDIHGMGLQQSIENGDSVTNKIKWYGDKDERFLFVHLLTDRLSVTDVLDYSPDKPFDHRSRENRSRNVFGKPEEPEEPEGNGIPEEAKSFIRKCTCADAKRGLIIELERIAAETYSEMVFTDEDEVDAKKYIDDHKLDFGSNDHRLETFLNEAPKGLIQTFYAVADMNNEGLLHAIEYDEVSDDDMNTNGERICFNKILNSSWEIAT